MSLLSALINRLTKTEQPAPRRWYLSPRRTAGQRVTDDNALTFAAVWRAINLISSGVAVLPWHVLKTEIDAEQRKRSLHLYTHPAQVLLDIAANDEVDAFNFKQTLVAHALASGNGYAEIERDNSSRPGAMYLIDYKRVNPDRTNSGRLVYEVDNSSGANTILEPRNMFHLKGLGFDGVVGYSVIAYAARSIGLGMATDQFGANFFANGAHTSMILEHPGQLGDTAHQHLKQSLSDAISGDQQHSPLILEEGMTAKPISIPPDDAQFLQTRQHNIDDVARWYGVPPHKLMQMEKSSFNNIEQQNIEFATDTLAPWAKRLESEANIKLISPSERRRVHTKLDLREMMRGDMESRMNFYRGMFDMGAFSPNDILEREGENPIGPQGDKRLVQLNLTTLDKAGEQSEPAPMVQDPEPENAAMLAIMGEVAERINTREQTRVNHALARHSGNRDKFAETIAGLAADHAAYLDKIFEAPRDAYQLNYGSDFIASWVETMTAMAMECFENGETYPANTTTGAQLIEAGKNEIHE